MDVTTDTFERGLAVVDADPVLATGDPPPVVEYRRQLAGLLH